MKTLTFFLLSVSILLSGACQESTLEQVSTVYTQPLLLDGEGLDMVGTENLMFVPENRNKPDSRLIGVHFFRLPAKEKATLPPVFYLPGGPGGRYDVRYFYESFGRERAKAWVWQLDKLRETREVIIMNQRGHSYSPGFQVKQMEFGFSLGEDDKPFNADICAANFARAYSETVDKFKKVGVDVEGYDIRNMVGDIEDVRNYLGVEEIALMGTSFGSQWALAYHQTYPQQVDRMLLSGIEPLDHGYDDPAGIWKVLERLAQEAEKDPKLKELLPEGGFMAAYQEVVKRFEKGPLSVRVSIQEEGIDDDVIIGLDDLRENFFYPFADDRRESLASWPKYVLDLYHENYEMLGLWALEERGGKERELLMSPLIDNSLGISRSRDNLLSSREEIRWIGDPNILYKSIRELGGSVAVDDEFRTHVSSDVPLLMIQGDMDWSTPMENAEFLADFFPNHHMLTVHRGTHDANRELVLTNEVLAEKLLSFMNKDFDDQEPSDFFQSLPSETELEKIPFWPVEGPGLMERLIE
ncbi:MAG: alpha/beta hydrolase [Bacteroidota bacterium]